MDVFYGDVCTTMKSPNYALLSEAQLFSPRATHIWDYKTVNVSCCTLSLEM